jgi:hypothetical protein
MPCPLYQSPGSENPLKVCGPKNRAGLAPSSAHIEIFCLSVSAYSECPAYKVKTRSWREGNWWERFFKQISYSFLQRRKKMER